MEHPAAVAGTLEVVAVLTIDVEADDHDEGIRELARLLQAHEAETVLVAGPVGATTIRRVADIALVHHYELLAVMPIEVLAGCCTIPSLYGEDRVRLCSSRGCRVGGGKSSRSARSTSLAQRSG